MNTGSQTAALYARRAAGPLTAADAVAWFAPGTPSGRQVVGYALSARAATWLRVRQDGTVETAGDADSPLADAYDLLLFDGERELRWLHGHAGTGTAIAVGEDREALPPGDDITADPAPRRGATHTRLLAGDPHPHDRPGWTLLRSERYASVGLPSTCGNDEELTIETVEYLAEDEHGNLDVVDSRTLGLRAVPLAAVRVVTAVTTTGRERTAA